jgi:signal transduction histidine kinase
MSEIDFRTVFEGMPEAAAICDEDGKVLFMNRAARVLLEPYGDVRLTLTVRETVRQMRVNHTGDQEFFMADVAVEGAARQTTSISLHPLPDGGYRVSFAGDATKGLPANVRILQALVNAHRHADLFKSADKVAALFVSCFAEVFPDYSFYVAFEREVLQPFLYSHSPWDAQPQRSQQLNLGAGRLSDSQLSWRESLGGWRHEAGDGGVGAACIQVEKRTEGRFSVTERAAFETFLQQLAFALFRLWHQEDLTAVTPILDQLDAVVIICDARRRIRVANRTFEELVYQNEVVGRDILDFFSESSRVKLRTAAASIMAGGTAEPFEAALVNGDGESSSQVILTIQVSPNRPSQGGAGVHGFIVMGQHNELSLVLLEERLNEAEHLMNIGQLATGVAHELKNPLTTILNYADYLLRKYDDQFFDGRDRERLQRIVSGVEHIDAFVQDLMLLARPDGPKDEVVDLKMTLHESLAICEMALRKGQTTVTVHAPSSVSVRGSQTQLKQVFVNLLTNAAHAMPAERAGLIVVDLEVTPEAVIIRIRDNALGMSQEVAKRIFEPFYTTRDESGGTGLGLAIVESVVRRHRGTIDVESVMGSGTTFIISLPGGV